MFRPLTIKLAIIATLRVIVQNALTNLANSIYQNQTDHIGSVGSVSTLIESRLWNEWQWLKNGFYKAITLLFDTYL